MAVVTGFLNLEFCGWLKSPLSKIALARPSNAWAAGEITFLKDEV